MERLKITQNLRIGTELQEVLKYAIQERGLNQRDIAAKVGIKQPNLSNFLAGKAGLSVDDARTLAEVVGLRMMARLEIDFYR